MPINSQYDRTTTKKLPTGTKLSHEKQANCADKHGCSSTRPLKYSSQLKTPLGCGERRGTAAYFDSSHSLAEPPHSFFCLIHPQPPPLCLTAEVHMATRDEVSAHSQSRQNPSLVTLPINLRKMEAEKSWVVRSQFNTSF